MLSKGSGYIAHPAVTDNCMQLGPLSGLPPPGKASPEGQVTRYAKQHACGGVDLRKWKY